VKFLLDSSVVIPLLNGREPALTERYVASTHDDYALCSVVKAELLLGAQGSTNPSRATSRLRAFWDQLPSLPFDDLAAEHFAEVGAALRAKGKPIGVKDLMIAATARARGLTVVTRNLGEFRRVPALRVERW
jgi:tRNA(fMet)-specific endonuclease VapC